MAQGSRAGLTRAAACEALGLSAEALAELERAGPVPSDPEGRLDPLALAAAALRLGRARADGAERKIASVAAALSEVRPALERLADLPARAGLEGELHDKAMIEVAAFFTAFAEAMNRATATLTAEDDSAA